ncbi:MAG TPA: hypothetical protein PKE06_07020 [Flavilitoribacter sp.]|nr:hypothetical protein [Flavilitoribacter sp.]
MIFGKYQFLSWARRGISAQIQEKDTLGAGPGTAVERASISVSVQINGAAGPGNSFTLLGPGDITGIHQEMIIRTEPRDGIPDFEPNLLPYIEFYDEDFPWRYTPASAAGAGDQSLKPWIALLVLREGEFTETERRTPLSSIKVVNPDAFPPPDELHLWAHMHSNLPHEESEFEQFIEKLGEAVKTDPDGIYSRLICPRKLDPNTVYHAFLVPAYETGRLAGLERSPAGVKAQQPSWPNAENEFPVYYRWQFRTGQNFDFEYLVKLLEPRVMDKRVGLRPMDCSRPGFVQVDAPGEAPKPTPDILLLEGALKSPSAEPSDFPPQGQPQPFFEAVEKLVNLNRFQAENPDEDPYITVPFYGMHHAAKKDPADPGKQLLPVFDPASGAWYNDLNRDPRTRTPAGFGVQVVQHNQEKFMDLAWKQLSRVLDANRRMQLARFTVKVSERLYAKTISRFPAGQVLAFTHGVASRIRVAGATVRKTIRGSQLAETVFKPVFRKMTRNRTSLVRTLNRETEGYRFEGLVQNMNAENGITAAPVAAFETLPAVAALNSYPAPAAFDQLTVWSVQSNLDQTFVFNLQGISGGLPGAANWNGHFDPVIFSGGVINPGNAPVFELTSEVEPDERTTAYDNASFRLQYSDAAIDRPFLQVNEIRNETENAVTPSVAFKKMLQAAVKWPAGTQSVPDEDFLPAMVYPDIPDPAYKYLVEIDEELLLPNLDLIPQNTLSLLRTNQKFIEAYLVGLNFEMGRELLWREYPTDRRGSYFRQFWDVRGFVTPNTTPANAESMKDIQPIHTWPDASELGAHNARDAEGDPDQLVFVIRGDLLKKFPNTVIYAQKAFEDAAGKKVIHTTLTEAAYEKEILFPQYQAELPPDIKLLGFDLTIEEAAGAEPGKGFTDNLGWFFIIAEVPGEPRFGMDVTYNPNTPGGPYSWNDLSWENFSGSALPFIRPGAVPGNTGDGKQFIPPQIPAGGIWGKSSADMAAILIQRPVMVAVHATEMLNIDVPDDDSGPEAVTTLRDHVQKFFPGG